MSLWVEFAAHGRRERARIRVHRLHQPEKLRHAERTGLGIEVQVERTAARRTLCSEAVPPACHTIRQFEPALHPDKLCPTCERKHAQLEEGAKRYLRRTLLAADEPLTARARKRLAKMFGEKGA